MNTIGGIKLKMLRAANHRFGVSDNTRNSQGCDVATALEGFRAVTMKVQAPSLLLLQIMVIMVVKRWIVLFVAFFISVTLSAIASSILA